ncbi:MAG: DUF1822 family protein [Cyanobacteria bacterium P01_D01_bin.50]
MNLPESFPEAARWNIDKLISDINAVRSKYKKGEITEVHKDYLYGALVGYSPKDISHKLGLHGDGKGVRTAFSTEINPYIRVLLDYPKELNKSMNWQRTLVLLEKAGYKLPFSSPDYPDDSVTKIKLDSDNPSVNDLQNILAKIQEMTQDKSIEIRDIRTGCIELVLSGSSEGLKRLESLVQSGELKELNGIRIISADSAVEPSRVVRLSNWFDNLVESGWQALEQVLNPRQLQFEIIRNGDISKGKLIDRTMLDDGFAVVLTLKQERLANDSFDIVLRLYSTPEKNHLPSGIKMRMFYRDSNNNEVGTDIKAGSSDEWIKLNFTGKSGDEFAVEIVKGDISVIDRFVI